MPHLFQFESDFTDSLRCIPMQVRFNLDTCGVKLKLHHWNHLTIDERQTLISAGCSTEAEIQAYRSRLQQWVQAHTGETPADLPIATDPDWLNPAVIPESVQTQSHSVGVELTLEQWASLSPLQRFALIKLSRSQHENKNFVPALKEFQVIA
jgi:hypothetical protein